MLNPQLVQFILSCMLWLQPSTPWIDTYAHTAQVLADNAEANPFTGKQGPDVVFTAAILTEWAAEESRYNPDARGDSGHSLGILQVNPWTADPVHGGKEELLTVETSVPIALSLMHVSFKVCHRKPIEQRLAQYAYGRDCDTRAHTSQWRIEKAQYLVRRFWSEPMKDNHDQDRYVTSQP